MPSKLHFLRKAALVAGLSFICLSVAVQAEPAPEVATVMDRVVERMYQSLNIDELAALDNESIWCGTCYEVLDLRCGCPCGGVGDAAQ